MLPFVTRARGVGLGIIVAVLAGATAATATADLVADYRFDGDFKSSAGVASSRVALWRHDVRDGEHRRLQPPGSFVS